MYVCESGGLQVGVRGRAGGGMHRRQRCRPEKSREAWQNKHTAAGGGAVKTRMERMQKAHPPHLLVWHRLRLAAGRTITWGAMWRRLHCGCGGGVSSAVYPFPTRLAPHGGYIATQTSCLLLLLARPLPPPGCLHVAGTLRFKCRKLMRAMCDEQTRLLLPPPYASCRI